VVPVERVQLGRSVLPDVDKALPGEATQSKLNRSMCTASNHPVYVSACHRVVCSGQHAQHIYVDAAAD
jgi:hypothetical protein